ncbi:MAG: UDP-N-acetylglucosamine--N-acetylmuramyl-(pentapeptide) pyrophosphoryl-undecaprenol N-acetylglucosamine transferase [Elusimicrobia bacterium]|nr:UDP-N-acetylglucosamine--N-acetylmuramyl-(pentapeptide) pyrophosphoryl-undecaprenol N-acetylglucosamine transferase [Elusimicrobiota bacterium]
MKRVATSGSGERLPCRGDAPKRIVIAAGGTGGHFYPGLVLAQTLRQRGWEPLMVVRTGDPALPRLEAEALPTVPLDLTGLSRRPGLGWASFTWKLAGSLRLADRVLRDFDPRVAVGMGGYLTFPAALAAWRRGVPCAVHESNSTLGLANRASLALGASLLRGLPPAPGEPAGELTGTPVRPSLWAPGDPAAARQELGLAPDLPTVLVFGGSQGARGVNREAPAALAQAGPLQVIHLAGAEAAAETESLYARSGLPASRVRVLPYLDAMEKGYAAADLVVCRAGASTLAELAGLRKPAVLVPYPHAAGRHQDANAALLAGAGAARVVPEAELASRLGEEVRAALASGLGQMSRAYDGLAVPCGEAAVRRLADAVERIARP